MTSHTTIGVDIAKQKFDVFCAPAHFQTFENNPQGIEDFSVLCQKYPNPRVVLEATGGYERALIFVLCAKKIEVCLVNPLRIRAYIQGEGVNAKTDRIDAKMIQKFGTGHELVAYREPTENEKKLRSLYEVRIGILDAIRHIREQREIPDETKKPWLDRQMRFYEKELKAADKAIVGTIKSDAQMQAKSERLSEVKGAGPMVCAAMLAYVPELGNIEENPLKSLIGVAAHPKDSGTTSRPRHIRCGRSQVRRVLYMCAISAARYNEILSAFYNRLRLAGKPAKVALVAVMAKLLRLFNRLLKDRDFSLTKVGVVTP
jgi:transposase